MNDIDTKLENYEYVKKLGEGKTGDVFLSKDSNENLFAIKIISKSQPNIESIMKIKNSIEKTSSVQQMYIKENDLYNFIIMEYINGGNLSKIIDKLDFQSRLPIPECVLSKIIKSIVEHAISLQGQNISYSYIKMNNILVSFKTDKDLEELNMLNADFKIQTKCSKYDGKYYKVIYRR